MLGWLGLDRLASLPHKVIESRQPVAAEALPVSVGLLGLARRGVEPCVAWLEGRRGRPIPQGAGYRVGGVYDPRHHPRVGTNKNNESDVEQVNQSWDKTNLSYGI